MKIPLLLLLCLPACATLQERRCSAFQDELADANAACKACLSRLSAVGGAGYCEYVYAHSAKVNPEAVASCTVQTPPAAPPAQATAGAQ